MLARLACLVMLTAIVLPANARPNILILMAEDMSNRVGAFGDQVAVTPNLDQLAAEGVRYRNVFTTAGVCAPSRAAFITGMHQISIGAQHMRTSTRPEGGYLAVPPTHVKAFPEYLRREGYYTFTDLKLDYQFSGPFAGSGPFTIWDEEGMGSDWRGREDGQPFFGLINFLVSHESGVFPPLGNWPNNRGHFLSQVMRWVSNGWSEEVVQPEDVQLEPYYPDTETVREDIARHYNNIHAMDEQVGEILERLRQEGLLDNTIVIWTTDHGDGLPRAKRDLYDSGIHVPMIVRWPGGEKSGTVDERLVSFVDFAPTVMKLAGIERPKHFQGRDFLSLLPNDFVFASRDRIDAVADRRRAVRNNRFKLIRNWYPENATGHWLAYRDNVPMVREMFQMYEAGKLNDAQQLWFEATGPEQLYDLKRDPYEHNNLIGDPAYKYAYDDLSKVLDQWLIDVGDTSEMAENEMVSLANPDGVVPVTAMPVLNEKDGLVSISSVTEGASIGYQLNGGAWKLFSKPVRVDAGDLIRAKAVRYGWLESEEIEMVVQ